ncbi:cellulose binding domain-containing protein [Micromonospora sp. NBC_00860]|uniref:cellulose binding domain-containing protein n=1 Tax=Micromonospora sp. NBC_00860 TaxID=2975980 RepID=UPI003867B4E0|nr:cellulose binding domain-containing protein [Micromonospora sp. NBC_00860]
MSGMRRVPRPPHGPVAIATSPWIVVGAGVVVMGVLLFVALGAYRGRSPAPDGARPPALPVPSAVVAPSAPTSVASPVPALPGISGRASGLPPSAASGSPSADPTVGSSGRPTATRSPSRASSGQPAMTGRYRVVQSFDGGFIGEVAMVNESARSRGWTVRLEFSGGRLVTAWVEGVPQGTIRESDGGFTYVSGVEVSPGGSVSLRFHMERASSSPRECTVDGVRCDGL